MQPCSGSGQETWARGQRGQDISQGAPVPDSGDWHSLIYVHPSTQQIPGGRMPGAVLSADRILPPPSPRSSLQQKTDDKQIQECSCACNLRNCKVLQPTTWAHTGEQHTPWPERDWDWLTIRGRDSPLRQPE